MIIDVIKIADVDDKSISPQLKRLVKEMYKVYFDTTALKEHLYSPFDATFDDDLVVDWLHVHYKKEAKGIWNELLKLRSELNKSDCAYLRIIKP